MPRDSKGRFISPMWFWVLVGVAVGLGMAATPH